MKKYRIKNIVLHQEVWEVKANTPEEALSNFQYDGELVSEDYYRSQDEIEPTIISEEEV